jgi:hypothetical protein
MPIFVLRQKVSVQTVVNLQNKYLITTRSCLKLIRVAAQSKTLYSLARTLG